MINLLLLYDQINTTTEVNISGTVSIYDDGNHSFRIKKSCTVTSDDLNWCDACFANRPSSIYMVRIGKALKRSGRVFMALYDDDLLDLPKGNSGRWKKKYVKKCLHLLDIAITCNPLLKSKLELYSSHPKYVNLHTHICEEDIKTVPDIRDKVRLIYAAGVDHTELFEILIKPSLDRLAEKYVNKVSLTLMGVNPNLTGLRNQEWICQIPTLPYDEYNRFMKANEFDIGLAPLFDTPFSNKKYFNKFFEYSKNGITGIYSNHLPYTFIIKDKKNGLLVENTVEDWYRVICYAIDNIENMKEIVRTAQIQLREQFSLNAIREEIHKEIDSFIESQSNKKPVEYFRAPIREAIFEYRCKYHQFVSHLYSDGFRKSIGQVLERLNRKYK